VGNHFGMPFSHRAPNKGNLITTVDKPPAFKTVCAKILAQFMFAVIQFGGVIGGSSNGWLHIRPQFQAELN
jgi:hypothetical protein